MFVKLIEILEKQLLLLQYRLKNYIILNILRTQITNVW